MYVSPPTKILIYAAAVFVCVCARTHIHAYPRMEIRGQLWEFFPTFTWMYAKDGA